MSITRPVCAFVALGIQHAMRVRHIIICCLPRCTTFFRIISQTARFSKKESLLRIQSVFRVSLQLLPETFLILRRTERDVITNVY